LVVAQLPSCHRSQLYTALNILAEAAIYQQQLLGANLGLVLTVLVLFLLQDAADQVSVEKDLEAGVKVLDSADLDFSRYADTLFEVLFAGGRLATGGNLADEQKDKLATNVSKDGMRGGTGCACTHLCAISNTTASDACSAAAVAIAAAVAGWQMSRRASQQPM
jgi:hypothetical protein